MPDRTIPADVAAELYESADLESASGWTRITDQLVRTSRWQEHRWLIVSSGGGFFGVPYADGLTESQEHDRPWDDDEVEEIAIVPLVGVPITTTKYLTEKQYGAWLARGGTDA